MREVRVKCTWESTHTIEVPEDSGPFRSDDLEGLLDASDEDVDARTAELVDWDVRDPKR